MAKPTLFFSDLIDGPRTGWNGSSTVGAAVTIWGKNFGSSRGSSYITVAGQRLTSDSSYAEWGVTTNNARGMERITFYLNSSCSTGAQTVSVTVGGSTSNTLPFYIRTTGNIKFVDHNNGSDTYDGTYDAYTSGTIGPWKTVAYARQHISGGDIVYIRNGTYTELDQTSSILYFDTERNGSANAYTAFIGYPNEFPTLDGITNGGGGVIRNNWTDTGYIVVSKMKLLPLGIGVRLQGSMSSGYHRVVCVEIDGQDQYPSSVAQCGAINIMDISHIKIYGCHVHNWGHDRYDHGVYAGNNGDYNDTDFDIGWNEFNNLGWYEFDTSGIYIHPIDTHTPETYTTDVLIHDNYCHDLGHAGIHLSSHTIDVSIYNNLILSCGSATDRYAIHLTGVNSSILGNTDYKIYNNTLYTSTGSALLGVGYLSNFTSKNNIYYSLDSTNYFAWLTDPSSSYSSDYDCWYGNGTPPAWATNYVNSDPLFVTNGSDFHLQSTSPCINEGVFIPSMFTTDYDGLTRGSTFDVGAYEESTVAPVLFFSDLTDGPRTGWEQSSTKGCAVTIWGENFGTTRGSSFVTIAGQSLTSESSYAEWGVTTNNARGMERITFYLNSSCSTGAQTISVTVNGITSNTLPFYVRTTGNIFFTDHDNGSDSYNGLYATYTSGVNGPKKTLVHTPADGTNIDGLRSLLTTAGDIGYVRSGTYTESDFGPSETLLFCTQMNGAENSYTAICGYPGEFPTLSGGMIRNNRDMDASSDYIHHLVFSKLKIIPAGYAVGINWVDDPYGYFRVISLECTNPAVSDTWNGLISFHDCKHAKIYGCNLHDWGGTVYDHAIYLGQNVAGRNTGDFDIGWNEIHDLGVGTSGPYPHPMDSDEASPKGQQTNVIIHDNEIYNLNSWAIGPTARVADIKIYNNLIYNCAQTGYGCLSFTMYDVIGGSGGGTAEVYNNTIYSSGIGIIKMEGATTITCKNNIFYSLSSAPYVWSLNPFTGTRTSNYDCWYGNGTPPTWATNTLNSDPLFVTNGSDFHLQSTSPCINEGVFIPSMFTTDYDGLTRGSTFDVGAYEYEESTIAPVLFFSDLIDGPRTGWNGSSTVGAAVTIWGNNFGSSRGSSYVTVGNVKLTSESSYAEWRATLGNARGMERITFWLNSDCATGAQTISVTVNGITSNTLPFYVRTTGDILFVDHDNGNDSYNGTMDTFISGSDGPKKTLPSARSIMTGGDILYIRSGTYTETDSWSYGIYLAPAQAGSLNSYTGYIAYPEETPILTYRVSSYYNEGVNSAKYFVVSKLSLKTTGGALSVRQQSPGFIRFIGNDCDGVNQSASTWSGMIAVMDMSDVKILGNSCHNFGVDKYDHAMYIGNNQVADTTNIEIGWNEVYNFNNEASGIYVHPQDTDETNRVADDVDIHDNYCHDTSHCGIFTHSRLLDIRIYNNIVANCGVDSGGLTRPALQLGAASSGVWGTSNILVYNNTVTSGQCAELIFINNGANLTFKNNIFYTLNSKPYTYDYDYVGTRTSNYDCWYGYGTPPAWTTNYVNSDPKLMVDGSDFHLQSTSPCIGTGTSVASVFTTDYSSLNRGSTFDIGAYEYEGATSNNTLFFSDLIDAPYIGWEQSSTKGAAVTIWGKNFGSGRGSNYVTVGGVNLVSDSNYAEWGTTTNNARGLERITFWLNSDCATGAQIISVTVGGVTSNALPLYIRTTGDIFFVDGVSGNDSYDGQYATYVSGSNGPKKTITGGKGLMGAGDILYIRNGTYTDEVTYNCILYLSVQGTADNNVAYIGYPGELPLFNDTAFTSPGGTIRDNSPYTESAYTVVSKISCIGHSVGLRMKAAAGNGGNCRVVGMTFDGDDYGTGQMGKIDFHDICHIRCYGNIIKNVGSSDPESSKYNHAIYVGEDGSSNLIDFDIGWNEVKDFNNHASGIYIHPEDNGAGDDPNYYADNVLVHDNVCYNLGHAGLFTNSRCKSVWFYNNIVYNCGSSTLDRPSVEFNHTASWTLDAVTYYADVRFYNNTIYSAASTTYGLVWMTGTTIIKNNILYSLSSTPYTYGRVSSTSDYDCYYGNGSAPDWATNALNSDPKFTTNGSNYHLQVTSPCIAAGTDLSSVFTTDYDGIGRGTSFDIGAYEYVLATQVWVQNAIVLR